MSNDNNQPKDIKSNKEEGIFDRYFGLGGQADQEKELVSKYVKSVKGKSEPDIIERGKHYIHPSSFFIDVMETVKRFDLLEGCDPDDDRISQYMSSILEEIHSEDGLIDQNDLVIGTAADLEKMDSHDHIEVNVWGYASLMINNLLNPDNLTLDDCVYIKNFMGELIFVARPTLLSDEYITKAINSRDRDQLDELCLLLVDGLERKVNYAIDLGEDPLF